MLEFYHVFYKREKILNLKEILMHILLIRSVAACICSLKGDNIKI